ncbi:MAG: HEPN domain-containing protein [Chitinispirillales bacterium]|jgi:HEPN domain-containing protein|nr:HEPN domain-containing protein [Chitinispirillales bacterium]
MADSLDVLKWIKFAQNDYEAAVILSERFRPPIEAVCYHCQQSAEKILKAYVIAQTGKREKTHNLELVLNECLPYSTDFSALINNCLDLNPYLSLARYPSTIEPTAHHMKQAIKDAGEILEFTKAKLKEIGYEYCPEN